jgi:HSP20 family protein
MAEETKKHEIQKAPPARALSPFEEMDRMFDQYFRRGWMRPVALRMAGRPGDLATGDEGA